MKRYYVRKGKLKEALDLLEIVRKIRRMREERAGG
jgi:hypothetical protein